MRLITAPCVGIVVGGFVEAAVFAILTILDSSEANFAISDEQAVILAAIIGGTGGGFVGGIIGLVVALRDPQWQNGLLLGSAIGLAAAILLAIRSLIPAGASIGFVSAVSTAPSKEAPSKEPQPPPNASKSYRIFE